MYLSRIKLNTSKAKTIAALASPSKLHGSVEHCFEWRGEKRDRKLWRVDILRNGTYLLIVSPEKPDLSKIKTEIGFPNTPDEIRNYDFFLSSIEPGDTFQFKLKANSVYHTKLGPGERGKVKAYDSVEQKNEWLHKKAEKNGFEIIGNNDCVIGDECKCFKRGVSGQVTLWETTFQGMLKVKDADAFRQALICGIGREKAYGMGMLTVVHAK